MKSAEQGRAVFLDRDGVLMADANYVGQVARVAILPGVAAGLRRLQAAGYKLLVITNQSGVARGYFTRAAVDEVHAHLDHEFARAGVHLDGYYVCPHHPDEACDCRKPRPRLLFEAAREHGLELARSYMIGDRPSDIAAGANAGTRTILVLTGVGEETRAAGAVHPTHVAQDLGAAADWILAADGAGKPAGEGAREQPARPGRSRPGGRQ